MGLMSLAIRLESIEAQAPLCASFKFAATLLVTNWIAIGGDPSCPLTHLLAVLEVALMALSHRAPETALPSAAVDAPPRSPAPPPALPLGGCDACEFDSLVMVAGK
jgi:hypothetical protein